MTRVRDAPQGPARRRGPEQRDDDPDMSLAGELRILSGGTISVGDEIA